jgi:hypothetical protein
MSRNDRNSIESHSAAPIEVNSSQPQPPDGHERVRRTDYFGAEPLDDPAYETIAQFFAAPRQSRQFKSVGALAEHFGLSRMTIYRRLEDVDVMLRIKWLVRKSMLSGDLIACLEWHGIVEAQVRAALAGDLRAAMFCEGRAWRQSSNFGVMTTEAAIAGVDAIAIWQEKANEPSQAELEPAKDNPGMEQDKNPRE